jgi:hypothetical protein
VTYLYTSEKIYGNWMAKSIERSAHIQYSNKLFQEGGFFPPSDILTVRPNTEPVYRMKMYADPRTCNISLSLIFCALCETLTIETCLSIGFCWGLWDVSLSGFGKDLRTFGAWVSVVVKALRYYSDGPGIDSRWCHWFFQRHISFRPFHVPGVDSVPSENEYQEHSWE